MLDSDFKDKKKLQRYYIELQREYGSLVAFRDSLRLNTYRYHGLADHDHAIGIEYSNTLEAVEDHARKACQLLQDRLEEIEVELCKL